MTVRVIKIWIVSFDDALGRIAGRGQFKGKVIRHSVNFHGRGAKGRATAKFNEVKDHNPTMRECDALVL